MFRIQLETDRACVSARMTSQPYSSPLNISESSIPTSAISRYTNSGGHAGTIVIQFLGRIIHSQSSIVREVIDSLDESNYSDLYTTTLERAECLNAFGCLTGPAIYDIANDPRLEQIVKTYTMS